MICFDCNWYDKECKYCIRLRCQVDDTDDCMNAFMSIMNAFMSMEDKT